MNGVSDISHGPLLLRGTGSMGPRPYIDAGVGTYYISNPVDVGLVAINETNWHLGFAPDAGMVQPMSGDTVAFVNARFNYVKAEDITHSYWGSESAWPGSPTEASRMQIADCRMETDKAANAAICFLRSVINTLHPALCLAANPHQALGQETKSSLAVAVAGGALGLYSGASRLPSHRSFLTVRRLFEASHAVLVSLFAVGCMPTYETSPTPHASRACPTRDSGTRVGSVNWYFPVADDDNRELERWCRTVGPPVIDSMPNGEFGTLDERDSLAIAVWNTDAGAGDLLAFITTELQLECSGTSSRLSHGSSHFVLLLQEALVAQMIFPPSRRSGSFRRLSKRIHAPLPGWTSSKSPNSAASHSCTLQVPGTAMQNGTASARTRGRPSCRRSRSPTSLPWSCLTRQPDGSPWQRPFTTGAVTAFESPAYTLSAPHRHGGCSPRQTPRA